MIKKLLLVAACIFAVGQLSKTYAASDDIFVSTFTGDFANGGDADTQERLLGNTSSHAFGIIQGNFVRIHIGSGTRAGGYSATSSTPSTAGYVGIWTDGITQFPQYHLDVWGILRSTNSAFLATSTGSVVIGSTTPAPGSRLTIIGTVTASEFIGTVNPANIPSGSTVYATIVSLQSSTQALAVLFSASTTSLAAVDVAFANNVQLATSSILSGNATAYVNINASTQTKVGGLILNGDVTARNGIFNAVSGDGSGLTNVGGFVNLAATQTLTGINTFYGLVTLSTKPATIYPSESVNARMKIDGSLFLSNLSSGPATTISTIGCADPGNLALGIDDNENTAANACTDSVDGFAGYRVLLPEIAKGFVHAKIELTTNASGPRTGDYFIKVATDVNGSFNTVTSTLAFSTPNGTSTIKYPSASFWGKVIDVMVHNTGVGGTPTIQLYDIKTKIIQ